MPNSAPQDYLIFHPERAQYQASGTTLRAGRVVPWEGRVWADRISSDGSSNEDPFIWTASWLYSFCHATQLRRLPRKEPFVREGSRLFFCSASEAKHKRLEVDTVFTVARSVSWQPAGKIPEEFLRFSADSAEHVRHLRHGTTQPGSDQAHLGSFTYVAQMDGASFLPMDPKGRAFSLSVASVLPEKLHRIVAANPVGRNSYPVMLTMPEGEALVTELRRAPVCVTSIKL